MARAWSPRSLAAVAAEATLGTTAQVLTRPLTRLDGGAPAWTEGAVSTGTRRADGGPAGTRWATHPTAFPHPPASQQNASPAYAPTMASDPSIRPAYGLAPSAYPQTPPKGTSTAALAASVFVFFLVLTGIAVLIVALVR